ncbi:MAG: BlaI/MecI/CopY family transcriptional regulator [Sandaracinus sp.]
MSESSLTELQLSVLRALWALGEAKVADVAAWLEADGVRLAKSTVATLLQRLSAQGWVEVHRSGRHHVYRAAVSRDTAAQGMVRRVLRGFFGGSVAALTAQLLSSDTLDAAEIAELRRLLDEAEK